VSTVTNGNAAMRRQTAASSDVVAIGCIEFAVTESIVIAA
jgi:hypothetical protein